MEQLGTKAAPATPSSNWPARSTWSPAAARLPQQLIQVSKLKCNRCQPLSSLLCALSSCTVTVVQEGGSRQHVAVPCLLLCPALNLLLELMRCCLRSCLPHTTLCGREWQWSVYLCPSFVFPQYKNLCSEF
jgi:hypothetical protein